MFKKILVAVGGPEASMEPARVAARMANAEGAALTFVSVHRATSTAFGEPDYSDRLLPRLAEAEHSLEQAHQIALREGFEHAELESLEGDPAQRIVELAKAGDYDLIVMGTHRRGRLGAALLGSVSHAVAAGAGRPVLVVPEQQPAVAR
ncbi:MAG TPA: universal stress protein [Candidatus Limnocylindria bacterium]|nr:universal stress protein [Candidatus Limnocylindria bacterium]